MMRNPHGCRSLRWLCAGLVLLAAPNGPAAGQEATPDPGEYLMAISGCRHCHTADDGEPFAGGRALPTPFGTFYTPNITAHRQAGIGNWSGTDFRRALHQGVAPDGGDYFPVFPYTSYTRMSPDDVAVLYDYLMSQPVSARANQAHELPWYLRWRLAARAWKWLFFRAGEFQPRPQRATAANRGAYIAEALAHCGECHTPRNLLGAMREDLALAGNPQGPDGEKVPNITPHPEHGIGEWSNAALDGFLQYGELPNGEYTAGSMETVIEGLRQLRGADRAALIEYLRALPPIRNADE